jgi:hypothetical protein
MPGITPPVAKTAAANTPTAGNPTAPAKSYLGKEAAIGGLSNAFFNGIIAWLMLSGEPDRTWLGSSSFAVDLVLTGFLLPMIVALIVIPIQQSKAGKGKVGRLVLNNQSFLSRLTRSLPSSTFRSSLVFGSIGALIIAPLTLANFWLLGVENIATTNYIFFKAAWTGLLAAVLVVPIVVYALNSTGSQDLNTDAH